MSQLENGNILVVDDDQMVRQIIQRSLEQKGYLVDQAEEAGTAYSLIEKCCYDAIFVDIVMPGDDGLTVLGQIKQSSPETPIILITGMPTVDTAATAVRLDAFDYLSKPLRHNELHAVTKRAVDSKRLWAEKKRLEAENLNYQRRLERMVEERTNRLSDQKNFLENMLEAINSPLYVVDPDNYRIVMANQASGFSSAPSNSKCYQLAHKKDQPCEDRRRCPVYQIKKSQKTFQVDHNHYHHNGELFIAKIHGYPLLDSSGKLDQIIFYVIDITDQKKLESIASAKNMMQNIGYVFSGIRHEIGNPINSLKTCLTVLKKQLPGLEPDQVEEFVTDALLETGRVEYLLKALKNFSLFERPEVERTDLAEFIKGLESMFRKDVEDKEIALEIYFPEEPCWGVVCVKALHHVMLNLLSNAVDALASRTNPKIEIHLREQAKEIQIEFIDNGCGMTERERGELFKPFHTTKPQGTGLGLVMVKKMLATMECSVEVSSWKEVGTSVVIFIPRVDYEV